jgi:hypothetical protein
MKRVGAQGSKAQREQGQENQNPSLPGPVEIPGSRSQASAPGNSQGREDMEKSILKRTYFGYGKTEKKKGTQDDKVIARSF